MLQRDGSAWDLPRRVVGLKRIGRCNPWVGWGKIQCRRPACSARAENELSNDPANLLNSPLMNDPHPAASCAAVRFSGASAPALIIRTALS
jgi:hypothetical protein